MGLELSHESMQVLFAFLCYLIGVALLGFISHRWLSSGSFVKEYFLGNRGLGAWVLALTIAATAISGGSFMGFPSLIYTNGWIMALWISSYMVAPITTMMLLGKRINQMSRLSGSVTVPDVLRDRFESPILGILASLFILVFMIINLVGQFKGGANVLETAMDLPRRQGKVVNTEVVEVEKDKKKTRQVIVHLDMNDGTKEELTVSYSKDGKLLSDQISFDPEPPKSALAVKVPFQKADGKIIYHRVNLPDQRISLPGMSTPLTKGYIIGLFIFAFTVVAYTTYGGFWAVTLTDVFLGCVMLTGVLFMAVLSVQAVPPITLEQPPAVIAGKETPEPVKVELRGLSAATERLRRQDPSLVYGPGPNNYLPLGMAFSFFLMWTFMGAGQPSGMVRLMSFKEASSARRATMLICGYFIITYMSMIVIFVCARAIFPTQYLHEAGNEALGEPDRIMPAMARHLTVDLPGGPFLAGLLLATPYAAIMSTVSSFLLVISSSLVRDLYQRVFNPDASERTLRFSSYLITGLVGVVVLIGALNPPAFLQYIIVFTGTGLGCSFLVPMVLTLYWKRATKTGVLASMVGGFLTIAALYVLGWIDSGSQQALAAHEQAVVEAKENNQPAPEAPAWAQSLKDNMSWIPGWGEERHSALNPIFLFGCDTLVWGLLASIILGIFFSLVTQPEARLVEKFFPDQTDGNPDTPVGDSEAAANTSTPPDGPESL